jgi:hypothetical protein
VTVNLTASPGPQKVVIKLNAVNDNAGNTGDISWPFDILFGDVNANRSVTNGDVASVQGQVGGTANANNFRDDVNLNGPITNGDVAAVQGKVGAQLPP